jgi:hypothetical protein
MSQLGFTQVGGLKAHGILATNMSSSLQGQQHPLDFVELHMVTRKARHVLSQDIVCRLHIRHMMLFHQPPDGRRCAGLNVRSHETSPSKE